MAGSPEGSSRLAHIPALDGLRGLAVAAVLLFHGEILGATGGFLGVSTFFTLSGFLITSLLLLEWERSGRVDLKTFWIRRARRLLPAAFVALLVVAGYTAFVATGTDAHRFAGDGIAALGYVANWRFLFAGNSYGALWSDPSPVQHFWSLAIEEQFYLLFPLLMFALLPRLHTRRRVGIALSTLALASAALAWLLWAPGQDPARIYYGTDTRAVELLVGAVLATRLAGRRRVRVRRRRMTSATLGFAALVTLVAMWFTMAQTDDFLYRGGLPLNALLTALVISGVMVAGPARWLLALAPLRRLGLISYGVYLYHWPLFLWLNPARTGLDGASLFGLRISVTIGVATASYIWLERPIREGRPFIVRRPRVLAPIAAATAAAALLIAPGLAAPGTAVNFSAIDRPAASAGLAEGGTPPVTVADDQALSSALVANGAPTLPVTGPGEAATPVDSIMVVGDSVALTLGRGIERWGAQNGVTVVNSGRLWCPIARGGRLATMLGRSIDSCSDWPQIWSSQIERHQPDVVVVLTTVWDLSPRQRDEWGSGYLQPGDARFDDYVKAEWSNAAEIFGHTGARVVWLAPACSLDEQFNNALKYEASHYFAAVGAAGALGIDLGRQLCPDGVFTNRVGTTDDVRPDAQHFSDAGADAVAAWLSPQLLRPDLLPPAGAGARTKRS